MHPPAPQVFISYSHDPDNPNHALQVAALAERLTRDGLNVHYDKRPPEEQGMSWPLWMTKKVLGADYVLIICTPLYLAKVDGKTEKGLGVLWEANLIYNQLYKNKLNTIKYLPVLLDAAHRESILPPLLGHDCFVLDSVSGYKKLLAHISKLRQVVLAAAVPALATPGAPRSVDSAADSSHASPSCQLVPFNTVLHGRAKDRDAILAAICRSHGGTVVISGMAGVGKTALAHSIAHELKNDWPGAQIMLDLGGLDAKGGQSMRPEEVMNQVIRILSPGSQIPLAEPLGDLPHRYRNLLEKAGRVLLLLDNAADASQVQWLIPPASCLMLVTSRQFFVLPHTFTHRLDCLPREEAARLLTDHAPRLAGYETEAAGLCGCLPKKLLAFAHVAAKRTVTPVARLLELLRQHHESVSPEDADFDVSNDLLPENDRARWHALAVFAPGFDLAAAQALWGLKTVEINAAETLMQTLVDAGLVEFAPTTALFRLLDVVRAYCLRNLGTQEETRLRMAHARYYKEIASASDSLYEQGKQLEGLALFDLERGQIQSAYAWLRDQTSKAAARVLVDLVRAARHGTSVRLHPGERILWLEAQLRAAQFVNSRKGEGWAFRDLGKAHAELGDTRKAVGCFEQALLIARELSDRRAEGENLNDLGNAYGDIGDAENACKLHEQARDIAIATKNKREEGYALGGLGICYRRRGDIPTAIGLYERWLILAREAGDKRGEGSALAKLGNARYASGDLRNAIAHFNQALVIAREMGDRRAEGHALGSLGSIHAILDGSSAAIECYEQALLIARQIGDRRAEGTALLNTADEKWNLGAQPEAIALAEAALAIFISIESPLVSNARANLDEWNSPASRQTVW